MVIGGGIGTHSIGGVPLTIPANPEAQINVGSILVAGGDTPDGTLVKATTAVWENIVTTLGDDWSKALDYDWRQWEEIIAGAFKQEGSEVILTPRSGDFGRDVIVYTADFISHKLIVSVKAYKPGNLVTADEVRALGYVLDREQDATKGILTTTSDFAPKVREDKFIKPLLPTRLQLISGNDLQLMLKNALPTANS